jgi:hypothetical protein
MEPRFSLPPDTPLSSKTELVIGGVRVYVYGLDELKCSVDGNIAILYLAHNRTRTYKVTEGVAHEVLHRYRTDGRRKKAELIAVTMNMRNHGDREVIISYIHSSVIQFYDIHMFPLDLSSSKSHLGGWK